MPQCEFSGMHKHMQHLYIKSKNRLFLNICNINTTKRKTKKWFFVVVHHTEMNEQMQFDVMVLCTFWNSFNIFFL